MKRSIIIYCLVLLFIHSVNAQNLVFYQDDTPLLNNAEVVISDVTMDEITGDVLLESGIKLKNTTNHEIEATLNQTIITSPSAGEISFCFYTCITGNVNRSQTATLSSNSFFPGFHLYYYAIEGSYTSAKVKYDVFDKASPKDVMTLTITYIYKDPLVGIKNPLTEQISVCQINKKVVITLPSELPDASLEIYSISGQRKANYLLPDKETFTLPEELERGIYILTIRGSKGSYFTQKFIVK